MKGIERKKIMRKQNKDKELTANEETNVRDIKNGLIYTKDNILITYLYLLPVNIELFSESEKESITTTLSAEFKGEKKCFSYLIIPRPVDMESYLTQLVELCDEENNRNRKEILNEMIREAEEKIMSDSSYEHQVYIQLWNDYDGSSMDEAKKTNELEERILQFEKRYMSVQMQVRRLEDSELIKLCNLFANSNTAMLEEYTGSYVPIPMIERMKRRE